MAGSPYFYAMFISNMAEHDKQDIIIGGVSKDVFSIILEFLYSGKCSLPLDLMSKIKKTEVCRSEKETISDKALLV